VLKAQVLRKFSIMPNPRSISTRLHYSLSKPPVSCVQRLQLLCFEISFSNTAPRGCH